MSSSPLPSSSHIRASFQGLAVCDALGGPAEFKPRGTFPLITTLLPNTNFGLPPGCFTDDTSMALCLAHSLISHNGQHDTHSQVHNYLQWKRKGYMSATNKCFDIGVSTSKILSHWSSSLQSERIRLRSTTSTLTTDDLIDRVQSIIVKTYSLEKYCGNGSLMRVLPCALIASTEDQAISLARASSLVTHPHPSCLDVCALYSVLVFRALHGVEKQSLVQQIVFFLTTPPGNTSLDRVLISRLKPYETLESWQAKCAAQIKSTGYVLDTLEAALWAFFTTETFRDGAVKVVNLGDDADTVGAVYGGLAGAFYGRDQVDGKGVPGKWWEGMTRRCRELVGEAVDGILEVRNSREGCVG